MQEVRFAFSFALERAGSNMPARMAMMAMTTNNSMRVNPPFLETCSLFSEGITALIYRDLKTLKAIPYVELAPTQVHLSWGMSQG